MLKVKGIKTTSPKMSMNPNFSAMMSHLQISLHVSCYKIVVAV